MFQIKQLPLIFYLMETWKSASIGFYLEKIKIKRGSLDTHFNLSEILEE